MRYGESNDEQCATAARDGDREAFSELVRRHQHALYRFVLRMLRSPDEALETAQDAFVRAWQALPGWQPDAAFRTWLFRIGWRAWHHDGAQHEHFGMPHERLPDHLWLTPQQRAAWSALERSFLDGFADDARRIAAHRERMIGMIFDEQPDPAAIEAERARGPFGVPVRPMAGTHPCGCRGREPRA